MSEEFFKELTAIIKKRRKELPKESYVSSLFKNGKVKIANKLLSDKNLSKEKILEEINELIEAVEKNSNKIHEAADVLYHLVMFLEVNDIKIEDVIIELNKRKK